MSKTHDADTDDEKTPVSSPQKTKAADGAAPSGSGDPLAALKATEPQNQLPTK